MSRKLFMIRHIPTGQMKAGGHDARFTFFGKLWEGIGRVKNHLRMYDYPRNGANLCERINYIWKQRHFPVEECEMVEVEIREVHKQPLKDFIEKEMK